MPKLNKYDDYLFIMDCQTTKKSIRRIQKIVLYTMKKNGEKPSYSKINTNNRSH